MMFSLPKVLDFTLHKQITIELIMRQAEFSKNIRLSPEGNDLECSDISSTYKRCTVHKGHFLNGDTGYYYTHHSNNNNKYIKFYESAPFKVILPGNKIYISIKKESNEDKVKLTDMEGVFTLVTNYTNKEKKIFDSKDNITFVGTFISEYSNNYYKANCRLWIPNEDNKR